jgi:hypothetical protein
MRLTFLLSFCCLIFIGCNSGLKKNKYILPQEKMQAVLWDMMRADQFLADYVLNKDTSLKKDEERYRMYQQVFIIHKIDKEIYQRSLSYYQAHPDLLKVMLDSLSKPKLAPIADTVKPKPVIDSLLTRDSGSSLTDSTAKIQTIKKMPID